MERADHPHLFSPSVGVWGKINFFGWHRRDRFFPYSGRERVRSHRLLPMKVLVNAVTPKYLGDSPVEHDRLNAHSDLLEERILKSLNLPLFKDISFEYLQCFRFKASTVTRMPADIS
ncbi:hypothetical protein TNCV_3249931 [Trichonephila clavipes]|nr:hypothetical protein TNCV_3249931 [Trichonephila clavipes]